MSTIPIDMESWISVPTGSDFPLQNLPFGVFRNQGEAGVGVAIGDHLLALRPLQEAGLITLANGMQPDCFSAAELNPLLSAGRAEISRLRERLGALLSAGNEEMSAELRQRAILQQNHVELMRPVRVPNYTDFYSSEEHATNVGRMFRDPKNALLPNWKHLPVGYHGRASSIVVSGTPVRRPRGQVLPKGGDHPVFMPSAKLDFELEMAFVLCQTNALGHAIPVDQAETHIAGLLLFNDWSARDIQQWEYVPLGPFLGKNFASTVSPWLVTLDALEPFRVAGPEQIPAVLPYLHTEVPANFDIQLEVLIQPAKTTEAYVVCRTNYKYMYWNMRQQLAHHTINGCNTEVGDLYASGTISGPSPGSYGSLLELSWNGERPLQLGGLHRTFLQDGDTVIFRGYAEKGKLRIGFGEARGTILPAL